MKFVYFFFIRTHRKSYDKCIDQFWTKSTQNIYEIFKSSDLPIMKEFIVNYTEKFWINVRILFEYLVFKVAFICLM